MATYTVKAPDGKIVTLQGPTGASQTDIIAQAQRLYKPTAPKPPGTIVQTRRQAIQETARRVVERNRSSSSIIPLSIRDMGASLAGSVNDATFGLPARLAAAVTGLPNNYMQEFANQTGRRAPITNFLGTLAVSIPAGGGIAGGSRALGAKLLASKAPALVKAGAMLRGASTLERGRKLSNATKIVGAGALAGSTTAAGKGEDIAEGALYGAGTAAVAAPVFKGAGWLGGKATDVLRRSGVDVILRRYTTVTKEQLSGLAADFRKRTGREATVAELLPSEDRENLISVIRRMPGAQRDRAAEKARQRVENIPRDVAAVVDATTSPRQKAVSKALASDIAASRGSKSPTTAEKKLAREATENPTRLAQLRRDEGQNIMAPFDKRTAYTSVDELLPVTPVQGKKAGQIIEKISDPEVAKVIQAAAGSMKLRPQSEGISIREITGVIQELKEDLEGNVIERGVAQKAISHLEDLLARDHPDVLPAITRMNDVWAKRSRQYEGMKELRLQSEVPAASARQLLKSENVFETPQGASGRAMGQRSELLNDLGNSTQSALGTVRQMAESGTTQRTLAQNLGTTNAGRISEAARTQSESARRLSSFVDDQKTDMNKIDAGDLALLASAFNPGGMAYTKARAVAAISRFLQGIPEGRARVMVDMLFSQDEKMTQRAINALRSEGEMGAQALRGVIQATAAGQVGASIGLQDERVPELNPDMQAENTIEPEEVPAEETPVDPGESPYAQDLKNLYELEDPEFLDLIGRVEKQESGGDQSAVSSAGAIGVMQVMPDTAPEAAELAGLPWDEEAYRNDATYNRLLGIAYLSEMLQRYDGNVELALAAYNAGPGRADQYAAGQSGLPAETQDYVARITG